MRVKVVVKDPEDQSNKSYIVSVVASLKSINDLKEHISSQIGLEKYTIQLAIDGSELLPSDKVVDVIRDNETLDVVFKENNKRRSSIEPSALAREILSNKDERDLDHAFLQSLEDIVLLRNHYQTIKKSRGNNSESIPVERPIEAVSKRSARSKVVPLPISDESEEEVPSKLANANTGTYLRKRPAEVQTPNDKLPISTISFVKGKKSLTNDISPMVKLTDHDQHKKKRHITKDATVEQLDDEIEIYDGSTLDNKLPISTVSFVKGKKLLTNDTSPMIKLTDHDQHKKKRHITKDATVEELDDDEDEIEIYNGSTLNNKLPISTVSFVKGKKPLTNDTSPMIKLTDHDQHKKKRHITKDATVEEFDDEDESESESESEDDEEGETKPKYKVTLPKTSQNTAATKSKPEEQKATLLKKGNADKRTVLNAPDPESEYLAKKANYDEVSSLQKKAAPALQKKIIQKRPEKPVAYKPQPATSNTKPAQPFSGQQSSKPKPFQPASARPLANIARDHESTRLEEEEPEANRKGTSKDSATKMSIEAPQQNSSGFKPQVAKPLGPAASFDKFVQEKFNLKNYTQIPPAVLNDMFMSGKETLIKAGDTVNYKATELDVRTFSPTVSDYKVAKVLEVIGDKIKLRIMASRAAQKKQALQSRNTNDDDEEEEEEDKEPVLHLHNFVEFYISSSCLNVERMQTIKKELTEFKVKEENKANAAAQQASNGQTQQSVNSTSQIVSRRVGKQVSYYFSDKNYKKDDILQSHAKKDPERYIDVSVLMTFPRVKQMSQNLTHLQQALKTETQLDPNCSFELNEDATCVRKRVINASQVESANAIQIGSSQQQSEVALPSNGTQNETNVEVNKAD